MIYFQNVPIWKKKMMMDSKALIYILIFLQKILMLIMMMSLRMTSRILDNWNPMNQRMYQLTMLSQTLKDKLNMYTQTRMINKKQMVRNITCSQSNQEITTNYIYDLINSEELYHIPYSTPKNFSFSSTHSLWKKRIEKGRLSVKG